MERDLGIPSSLVAPPVTGSVVALAKSQVGFMNLFAIPLFENLSKVLPEMSFSVRELNANKDSWSQKIELYAAQAAAAAAAEEKPAVGAKAAPSASGGPSGHLAPPNGPGSLHLPQVLGTALMDSDMPHSDASISGSDVRSGITSLRSVEHVHSGNGNVAATSVRALTLVVTHSKKPSRANGYGMVSEKRPTYQHSTEHLRAVPNESALSPDRPRSSPPDLGDCSDHSCSKGCCGTTAVVTSGAMERRSSRFFKKVKLWKGWRKEPSDG